MTWSPSIGSLGKRISHRITWKKKSLHKARHSRDPLQITTTAFWMFLVMFSAKRDATGASSSMMRTPYMPAVISGLLLIKTPIVSQNKLMRLANTIIPSVSGAGGQGLHVQSVGPAAQRLPVSQFSFRVHGTRPPALAIF